MKHYRLARIYTLEGEAPIDKVLEFLHEEQKVNNVMLIRAIAGYGDSGQLHTTSLLSLSMRLPLIIEFFAEEQHVLEVISVLRQRFDLRHIVSWPVEVNTPDDPMEI